MAIGSERTGMGRIGLTRASPSEKRRPCAPIVDCYAAPGREARRGGESPPGPRSLCHWSAGWCSRRGAASAARAAAAHVGVRPKWRHSWRARFWSRATLRIVRARLDAEVRRPEGAAATRNVARRNRRRAGCRRRSKIRRRQIRASRSALCPSHALRPRDSQSPPALARRERPNDSEPTKTPPSNVVVLSRGH